MCIRMVAIFSQGALAASSVQIVVAYRHDPGTIITHDAIVRFLYLTLVFVLLFVLPDDPITSGCLGVGGFRWFFLTVRIYRVPSNRT